MPSGINFLMEVDFSYPLQTSIAEWYPKEEAESVRHNFTEFEIGAKSSNTFSNSCVIWVSKGIINFYTFLFLKISIHITEEHKLKKTLSRYYDSNFKYYFSRKSIWNKLIMKQTPRLPHRHIHRPILILNQIDNGNNIRYTGIVEILLDTSSE